MQLGARDAPRRRRGRWGSCVEDENEEGVKRVAAAARPGNARDAGGAMSGTCPRRIAAAIAPVAARVIVVGGGGGGRRAIRGRVSLLPAAACRGARKGRWQVGPPIPVRVWWQRKLRSFPYLARKRCQPLTGRAMICGPRKSVKGVDVSLITVFSYRDALCFFLTK